MILPEQAIAQLYQKEWQNRTQCRARLKGERAFPVEIALKPPKSGNLLLKQTALFEQFVTAWQHQPAYFQVQWTTRQYRHFGAQQVPTKWIIPNWDNLIEVLGEKVKSQFESWKTKLAFLLETLPAESSLFNVFIDHLEQIEAFSSEDLALFRDLVPQLKPQMGHGDYLRALPLVGVDTKFVERHFRLLEDVLDVLYKGAVKEQGLLSWLNCKAKPKDWLLVKPLCPKTQQALGGLPLLRLSSETLWDYVLPAERILIVENEQSCLALPTLTNTIAVAGGGKNVAWLAADWLINKKIGYWGDIDGDGFHILSLARERCPNLTALMIDEQTILKFQGRMVDEAQALNQIPPNLTAEEQELFQRLRQGDYGKTRLEQERISADYIEGCLLNWLKRT